MKDDGKDSQTVFSFARIDFCSKYISFALLKLVSTPFFVLLPHPHHHMSLIYLELFNLFNTISTGLY